MTPSALAVAEVDVVGEGVAVAVGETDAVGVAAGDSDVTSEGTGAGLSLTTTGFTYGDWLLITI